MSDEDFELLAPGVLKSFEQSVNNPNDKIMLVQSLNASGGKAEDLTNLMQQISMELEEIETISKKKKSFLLELLGTITNAILDTEGIAKKYVNIPIELCHEEAKVPQYAHISDSGLDLFALDDYTITPGETKLIPTGIKVALPPGYEFQVRPKSGRALKTKLLVANTPGTIDAGYRDEIKVIIENIEPPIKDITYEFDDNGRPVISSILHGSSHFIGKGEKFAQLVLMEVPKASFYRVDSVSNFGEDRKGGFGSTGLN
jgi:dUTP pyrophosphatase